MKTPGPTNLDPAVQHKVESSEHEAGALIPAPVVARRLGWKTATLSNRRALMKDPEGAVHLSSTSVAYPLESVEKFEQELRAGADARREAARALMARARAARRPTTRPEGTAGTR